MTYDIVVPTFTGALSRNAVELCDLFRIESEEAVPVARFKIESSYGSCDFPVGPGKYKTALLFFYWMTLSEHSGYYVTPEMVAGMHRYYGDDLVTDARRSQTEHKALHFLLGHSPAVRLQLQPGYHDHLVSQRTIEDVIRHGWS